MEKCDFPKCRNLSDLGYIGHKICNKHWEQLCLSDSETEKRLLKKIGLIRNEQGMVTLRTQNNEKNSVERKE